VLTVSTPNALERAVNTTAKNLGLPYPGDLSCGNPAGLSPISHNNYNNIRSDACE
jgi:hypothetical protein